LPCVKKEEEGAVFGVMASVFLHVFYNKKSLPMKLPRFPLLSPCKQGNDVKTKTMKFRILWG